VIENKKKFTFIGSIVLFIIGITLTLHVYKKDKTGKKIYTTANYIGISLLIMSGLSIMAIPGLFISDVMTANQDRLQQTIAAERQAYIADADGLMTSQRAQLQQNLAAERQLLAGDAMMLMAQGQTVFWANAERYPRTILNTGFQFVSTSTRAVSQIALKFSYYIAMAITMLIFGFFAIFGLTPDNRIPRPT